MKRWTFLTVGLYGMCVLGFFFFGLFLWKDLEFFKDLHASRGIVLLFLGAVFLPLMLAAGALLFIPAKADSGRPSGKRSLLTAALLGSLPMGLLFWGFLLSLGLLFWGEEKASPFLYSWLILIFPGLFWFFWGWLFYRYLGEKDPNSFLAWATSWLLRGSILEILVALPSHVISRHRQECCAPLFTYYAIVAGLSVALLAFGPGLLFLFVRKIRNKRKAGVSRKAD
ncbi:MAG TPA: hypothetical protein PK364_13875 [Synergistaceae bacterium]|nr:hypothetical protein [Synergistaceae bacterium]